MPKVDFYVLKDPSPRLSFACRLLEKAYLENQKVYAHTSCQADAHALDEQLWTYRDNSFIPHNLTSETVTPIPPIQIGFDATRTCKHPILLNLSDQIPDYFGQFQRVIEIVDQDNKTQAREKFKQYRDQQCDLTTYNV